MKAFRNKIVLAAFLPFLLAAGCSGYSHKQVPLPHSYTADPPPGAHMLTANTYAGDVLAAMLLQRTGSSSAILSTSMVRMDNLDESSPFGRIAMQQVASRVAQHGFSVVDVRLGDTLRVNQNGEFMLTRDTARLLAQQYNAHAVLTGVYTPSGNRLFVSVRALRLSDSAIIAAYEYYLPISDDTQYLLSGAGSSSAKSVGGSASGDAEWSRYAARGQAVNCSEPAAVRPAAVQNSADSGKTSSSKAVARKSSGKKSAKKRVSSPASAQPAYASYPPAYTPAYTQGGDCGGQGRRSAAVPEYTPPSGGRWIDPAAPAR